MREFFKQCMEDLESISGSRQKYYLDSDLEDGERKKKVLLDGMVEASRKFDYIPEKDQQTIIRRMMIEDQNYESLNSRVIWKWLEMHKGKYSTQPRLSEEEIIPPPPLSEEMQKQIREYLANLAGSTVKPVPQVNEWDLKAIQEEDSISREGRKGSGYIPKPEMVVIDKRRKEAIKKLGLDQYDVKDLKTFQVEGQSILAPSLEIAQEYYIEVFT